MPLAPAGDPSFITVFGSLPAPGSAAAIQAPPRTRWRVLSVQCSILTDATVANRYAALYASVDASYHYLTISPTPIPASTSRTIWWSPGVLQNATSFPPIMIETLPDNIVLNPNDWVQIQAYNFAAGDQWDRVTAAVQEWLLP